MKAKKELESLKERWILDIWQDIHVKNKHAEKLGHEQV